MICASATPRILYRLALACLVPVAAIPAWADHSWAAFYDEQFPVRLEGTVTRYEWVNPNVWVFLDISSQSGRVDSWEVEFSPRYDLKRLGWTQDSVHVGDPVEIRGTRARDGSNRAHGLVIQLPNGDVLLDAPEYLTDAETEGVNPADAPTPRWPDGHPRLGPEPGQEGYWGNPSAYALYEDTGTEIVTDRNGLLIDLGQAPQLAPFRDWALALFRYRQQNYFKDDPMIYCLPPGGPRQFHARYGVRFLDQPERQRILVLSRGGNRNFRLIDMDGREIPAPRESTPTYFGYSTGRWDGDTLVVESAGYIERFWMSNGGLPHTESMRLIERFTRLDFDTLEYRVTIDDPGAYTRPWSARWTLEWIPFEDDDEYYCDDYNRELDHVN